MGVSRIALLSLLLSPSFASLYPQTSQYNHTCIFVPPYESCSPQASNYTVDSCCVETFGGLLLSTQSWFIWTALEDEGQVLPADTWTLHGLWPDFCNGSYTQYCDFCRQYDPYPSPNTTNGKPDGTPVPQYEGPRIHPFIAAGKYDILAFMFKYWVSQGLDNYYLWVREFSKHATCFSTFNTPCYGPLMITQQDVVDFFETVIMYYVRLPTWNWLAAHDIVPSNSTTYSLSDIESALAQEYGQTPYVGCTGPRYNETAAAANSTDGGHTQFSDVWYYFHVLGRPQNGVWVPTNQPGSSSCARAKGAINYFERAPGSVGEDYNPYQNATPPA